MIADARPTFRTTAADRDRARNAGLHTAAQWKDLDRKVIIGSEPQGRLDAGHADAARREPLFREDQTVEKTRRMARRSDS